MEAIAKTFTPLWRSRSGFKMKNLGDHVILFIFDDENEVERVLNAEPWCFDKHLVVMQKYDKSMSKEELRFEKTRFWVQIHGLPYKFMNIKAAGKICDVVGKVIHTNDLAETEGGNFMRIRVEMDISLPLCRGRVVSTENGKKSWITFKYERLPNICYWCGRMDHSDRDCELWLDTEGSLAESQKQFGPSLRAPPFFPSKKSVMNVPGFYSQKRAAQKTQMPEGRPESDGETSGDSRRREELTVVHDVDTPDRILNTQLNEKTDTINASNYSEGGYKGHESSAAINSPQNPGNLKTRVIGINAPEISGDNGSLLPTAQIGINPINELNKSSSNNPTKEAAITNSNSNVFSTNSLAREGQEVARVSKKSSTWTRLDRGRIMQQTSQAECTGPCKRIFSSIDDHSDLPCSKKQVLMNEDDFSFQMVEADAQPRQEQ